ncbi:MAG: sulfatase-like hydrolase/transferase [Planctomycetaceae bacterium]|jgi:arylsulfatase A-like enzyme|nr:sulfatase-like hydrolase/transferase [Planctomycetaceae bacterium]
MKNFILTSLTFYVFTVAILLSANAVIYAAENNELNESNQPNVLFIMVDEMRADALGCATEKSVYQTPALDRLASEGTRFAQTYTVAAVCVSSRYSFFTSRYSHVHGATHNDTSIRTAQILFPGIMKHLGYQTAISGKLHFHPQNQDYDFDYFWSFSNEGPKKLETWPQYLTAKHGNIVRQAKEKPFPNDPLGGDLGKLSYPKEDTQSFWITDRAIEFFNIRDKSKPFFLFVSYLEPHSPSHLAEPYWSQYEEKRKNVELSPTFVPGKESVTGNTGAGNSGNNVSSRKRHWVSDSEIAKAMTAAYHVKVKHVDDCIERLLDGLKKAGLEKDTLIVFTSDHGNMLGDHNRWFKGVPYEGSTRIPLIIKVPQHSSFAETFNHGKIVQELVESIDVMPTILDLIGKPLPTDPGFQGKSLTQLVAGKATDWKNLVFSERTGIFVRSGKYKLIQNDPALGGKYELYDLEVDPRETKDLSNDPALQTVIENLKQKLDSWQKDDPAVPNYPGLEPKFAPEKQEPKNNQRRQRQANR